MVTLAQGSARDVRPVGTDIAKSRRAGRHNSAHDTGEGAGRGCGEEDVGMRGWDEGIGDALRKVETHCSPFTTRQIPQLLSKLVVII